MEITDEQIKNGLDEAFKKSGDNAYFGNGFRLGVKFAQAKLKNHGDIGDVSELLPQLMTEYKDCIWIAWLKNCKGMVVQGLSEEQVIDELMTSIKVKMLNDR